MRFALEKREKSVLNYFWSTSEGELSEGESTAFLCFLTVGRSSKFLLLLLFRIGLLALKVSAQLRVFETLAFVIFAFNATF